MPKSPPPTEELIRQLADYDLRVGELALALRDIMLAEAPAAAETVFRSYALVLWYSFTGKLSDSFCYIALYTKHVNVGFYRGAELEDPERLLTGEGKQLRHIKILGPDDLKKPYLRKFIRAAIKHAKQRVKEKELARRSTKPAARATARKRSRS